MHFRIGLSIGLFAAATATYAAMFNDSIDSPYQTAIEQFATSGIVQGYDDGTFRPTEPINRAELLKILMTAFDEEGIDMDNGGCFPDVQDEWFAPYVCLAKTRGWISGYADGMFRPNQPVSWAEAVKMIMNISNPLLVQSSSDIASGVDPDAWYASFVSEALKLNILSQERLSMLSSPVERGEMVDILFRLAQSMEQQSRSFAFARRPAYRGGRGGGTALSANSGATLSSPLIVFNNISKHFGDAAFTLSPTSNSAGFFSYAVDNTAVATVAGNTVTIIKTGTTTITVTQESDGNFAAGSATATLVVSKANSTTSLTANSGSIHYGDNLTLTATVTSGATGIVSFYTGATLIGTGSISSGIATVTTTTMTKGTGSLTAVYGGDTNYNGSTSASLTLIVYRNACTEISPCNNGGTCTPVQNSYSCSCVSPWLGATCNDRNNNCVDPNTLLVCSGPSQGTCEVDPSGGICQCAPCYTGDYCELDDLACA